jgi:hypothetical protein
MAVAVVARRGVLRLDCLTVPKVAHAVALRGAHAAELRSGTARGSGRSGCTATWRGCNMVQIDSEVSPPRLLHRADSCACGE